MRKQPLVTALVTPALTASALLLAAGCSSSPGSATLSGSGSGSSAQTVSIGTVSSLTGTDASSGLDVLRGEELAVQIINGSYPGLKLPFAATPGLPALGGAKLKLVTEDDAGSPQTAASAVNTLVTEDHVSAIVGGYSSAVTANASQQADRLQVPFVNGASSADSLTSRGLQDFFRVGPEDATFAASMFGLLKQEEAAGHPVHTIAILHTNDTYGDGVEADTKAQAAAAGLKVVADIAYDSTTTDLSPEILQLKAKNPDVLFDSSYTSDAILLIRGMNTLGWHPQMLFAYGAGFSDPTFLPTLKNAADGVMSRASWSDELPNPTSQAVAKMFQQEFKLPMTENSARSFESVMAVAVAINNAKSTQPSAVAAALRNIDIPASQLITPWTDIKFNSDGQNTGASGIVQQVQDGVYKVVYPKQAAVAKVIWPMTGS